MVQSVELSTTRGAGARAVEIEQLGVGGGCEEAGIHRRAVNILPRRPGDLFLPAVALRLITCRLQPVLRAAQVARNDRIPHRPGEKASQSGLGHMGEGAVH